MSENPARIVGIARPGPAAGGRGAGQPDRRRPRRDLDGRRSRAGQPVGQHPVRVDDAARRGHLDAAARQGHRARRKDPQHEYRDAGRIADLRGGAGGGDRVADPADDARLAAPGRAAGGADRHAAAGAGHCWTGHRPGDQGSLCRQHAGAQLAGPDRGRRPRLPQQGGADPLPRGNHAAAQRRQPIWIPKRRSPPSAPNAASPAKVAAPHTASWRSGGGCRRAPRSTPDSAATTAANTRNGSRRRRREQEGTAGTRGRPRLHRHDVRRGRPDARGGGVLHRHVGLPGDADRPQLSPPDRGGHRPADRQHRLERRGRREPRRQDLGGRLRRARPVAAGLQLAGHRNARGRTGPPGHRRHRRHRHPRGGAPPAQPRVDEGRGVLR